MSDLDDAASDDSTHIAGGVSEPSDPRLLARDADEVFVNVDALVSPKVQSKTAVAVPRENPAASEEGDSRADAVAEPRVENVLVGAAAVQPPAIGPGEKRVAASDAPVPRREPSRIRGFFDGIFNGRAEGWGIDGAEPTKRLQIEIWEDDKLIVAGTASRERKDLVTATMGDGRCAFSIPLPATLNDGVKHILRAKVGGTAHVLEGIVAHQTPVQGLPSRLDGEHEIAAKAGAPVSRAAIAPEAPAAPSNLVSDERAADSRLASPPPEAPARSSESESAVKIDATATRPAVSAELHAQPSVTGDESGRATATPRPPQSPLAKRKEHKFRGSLDIVSAGRAEGWAIDETEPTKRLQIEIWEKDIPIAAGMASRYRNDLLAAKVGDGHFAFSISLPYSLSDGKEHVLRAKISGADFELPGTATFRTSGERIRGGLGVEGLTVRGWVIADLDEWITVDVLADGMGIGSEDIPPFLNGERHELECGLPLSLADGNVHWFQFRVRSTGRIIAENVAVPLIVSTPETALQTYARDFPGLLSANASPRYDSAVGQFAIARDMLEKQISDEDALSLADYFQQLALAHKQVKSGIGDRGRPPAVLKFPRFERPEVSVVIPAHNKFWVTYNCLAALLLAPNENTFEVIVVDDGSTDLTMKLSDYAKGITVIRNETSLGFVRSSNLGGRHARGQFVVMLNNDTEPCAAWIDELLYVFRNFPAVGMAGAKLVYPNGKLQEAGGIVFPSMNAWNYGRNGNQFDPKYNYTRQVDYVSGACIMLRKSVWDNLRGFDEFFAPAYYEDTDLAFRVRNLGLKTYYTPFSKIIHFEGVSSGTSLSSGMKRYQQINEPKFRSRWATLLRTYPSSLDPEIAKDRGVQLRALVIDAQIPQPDKDAGSYAAVQEMRLLQALGFKLTFVPMNMAYLGNYTEDMERDGVECLYAPFSLSIEQVIEQRGSEFDVFYITRYSIAERFIDKIRSAAPLAKIVFNNADLHFLREIRAAVAAKNTDALPLALKTRDAELAVMRNVDVTLSYTDTEAAVIVSHNLDASKVARCPWVIRVENTVKPFESRAGLAFLGNFQHPPNEEGMRFFISEIMPELRRAVPGLCLRIFGSNMAADLAKLAADDIFIEGYVADLAEVYQNCRVFIAPLLSGAGIKGKVIGALAAGTPTIMSSLASEGVGFSKGVEAVIADTAPEWINAVSTLYGDEKRWSEMSSRARVFARENFSFESGLAKMRAALATAGVYVG